jgi:tetratricopeptide (TPR) repeat protein
MPRRIKLALLSFWPGLPQIWAGQEVLGLILGALFAVTLNLAILSRTLWTELFAPGVTTFFTVLAVLSWLLSMVYTLWWIGTCHPARYRDDIDQLYRQALEHYLQGHWNDARKLYEEILALDETDADALVQLGFIFLHTDQTGLARRAFRQCLELEGGAKWRWEITQALGRLDGETKGEGVASSSSESDA